jgi:fermentation-respiration switch protein FrsA (DUF1100 family)
MLGFGETNLKRLLSAIGLLLLIGYASAVVGLYFFQRPLLYRASKDYQSPQQLGLVDTQEITIPSTEGVFLRGWFRPPPPGQPIVLFLHGKGGNISTRVDHWRYYTSKNLGVLFVDYRGFGESTGTPTETGLKDDVLAAYDWLLAKHNSRQPIAVTAESLGTGLAVYLATKRHVVCVSLMSAYSSIAEVAAKRYWWVPTDALMKDRFEILPLAKDLTAPLLLQHGNADKTIPIAFALKLFEAFASEKKLIIRNGKGHNDFGPADWDVEYKFIQSHV